MISTDVEDFMKSVVSQNLEYREKNNISRKDFFQLLIQLRNTGNVSLDDEWETPLVYKNGGKSLSVDEVTAQAFIFFAAGFETSSSTLSYCMYELAKNPEIQQKAHAEIDEVLKKHDGRITYESISDMKYLECCLDGKFN